MSPLFRSRLLWTLLVLTPAVLLTLSRPPARADAPKPAAAEDAALKAAAALYDGIRAETLDNGLKRLPQADAEIRRRHHDGRLQGRLGRRGPRPHRPVALPRTPDVQGHRQDHARRHRPHHAAQRRRQQRLHHRGLTRSSTSTSPPTAGRPALEIEADRMRNLRIDDEARVRAGKRGRHQRAGSATRTSRGTWKHKTILPLPVRQGRALRPSGHRRDAARRGRHRRGHQGALRQVVSPQQRLARHRAAASIPTRRWPRSRSCSAPSRKAELPARKTVVDGEAQAAGPAGRWSRSSTCREC